MITLTIKDWAQPVSARSGKTLLDAALAAGVPFPHSCRAGECGQCKSRLLTGRCSHDGYDPQVLSNDERCHGIVLACRARPKTDVTLQCLTAIQPVITPVIKTTAQVIERQYLTADVILLRLQLKSHQPMIFAAGQYARLQLANGMTRSYSMANRVGDAILDFYIRHLPDGLASTYIAQHLTIGEHVVLEGPYGNAFLREDHSGKIIALAGGTGLAPMLAIIRTALQQAPNRRIKLYFGVRTEKDIFALDTLAELQANYPLFQFDIILSEPDDLTTRRRGFLHHALVEDESDLRDCKIYAAGSPPMVEAVKNTAITRGLSPENLHCDPFTASNPEQFGFWQRLVSLFVKPSML